MKQTSWTPRSFPFYSETVEGVQGDSRSLHWHRELEILQVRRGGGKHLVNGREYEACVGDIFLIDNDEIHLLYEETDDLLVQVMLFDPVLVCAPGADLFDQEYLRPFTGEFGGYSSRLPAKSQGMDEMRRCLDEIERLYVDFGFSEALMIKAKLLQFFALVVRSREIQIQSVDANLDVGANAVSAREKQRSMSKSIRLAMDYMEAEYVHPINLTKLTELTGMSVSHFCSTFKKLTLTTPNEFLIRCRLAAAKERLRSSEDKILEIAQSCGFETLSNFNRAFLSHIGMTPGEYRRS